MKARELIEILEKHPDAEIDLAWEEYVQYSELTTGSEDKIEPANAVYIRDGRIVVSSDCYIIADRVWPKELGK